MSKHQRAGDAAWGKVGKVNAELFTLTYGALVMQLIQDFEDVAAVNKQLEKMGYNIGIRLIDEFLAKSGTTSCRDLADTAECIAKAAFKMFLGCTADVGGWNADKTAFSLMLYDTPLTEFVELPAQYTGLVYSNILCGVIRGALEMVLMKVECTMVKDVLRGEEVTEIRVVLKERLSQEMLDEYKES